MGRFITVSYQATIANSICSRHGVMTRARARLVTWMLGLLVRIAQAGGLTTPTLVCKLSNKEPI